MANTWQMKLENLLVNEPARPSDRFVRITEGVLKGLKGPVVGPFDADRLVVELTEMGAGVYITVNAKCVELVP
jgi:hypothetical protein